MFKQATTSKIIIENELDRNRGKKEQQQTAIGNGSRIWESLEQQKKNTWSNDIILRASILSTIKMERICLFIENGETERKYT